jgi:hypothetical protein
MGSDSDHGDDEVSIKGSTGGGGSVPRGSHDFTSVTHITNTNIPLYTAPAAQTQTAVSELTLLIKMQMEAQFRAEERREKEAKEEKDRREKESREEKERQTV